MRSALGDKTDMPFKQDHFRFRKWTVGAFGNTITIESERPVALSYLHLDHLHLKRPTK
jgi:hypothetical protein